MKARIIKRTYPGGLIQYIIQQKHFLFRWWWVDAWINRSCEVWCRDYFDTLEEAQAHLCYFDGTPTVDTVVAAKES